MVAWGQAGGEMGLSLNGYRVLVLQDVKGSVNGWW